MIPRPDMEGLSDQKDRALERLEEQMDRLQQRLEELEKRNQQMLDRLLERRRGDRPEDTDTPEESPPAETEEDQAI